MDKSGNYRPMSLISVAGKLLEKMLWNSICVHLERLGLIRISQCGFLQRKSCSANPMCFLEVATKEINEGRVVDAVYMDLVRLLTGAHVVSWSRRLRHVGKLDP